MIMSLNCTTLELKRIEWLKQHIDPNSKLYHTGIETEYVHLHLPAGGL